MATKKVKKTKKPLIAILTGSTSDSAIVEKVTATLDDYGIEYVTKVMSAHRTPNTVSKFVSGAEKKGIQVIIAGAGLSAALPGVVAAHTILPVIGLPIDAGSLNGMDALLSIVQMPPGIPTATVGINNGKNAAHLAAQILALGNKTIQNKVKEFRKNFGDI